MTGRYIDDLLSINNLYLKFLLYTNQTLFYHDLHGIYPDTLLLKFAHSGTEVPFRDISIRPSGQGTRLTTVLYNKRRHEPLSSLFIIKYPQMSSNISETAKFNIITSQFHRFLSIILSEDNFVTSMADVIMTLSSKGYPIYELLTRTYFLCWQHPESYSIQADKLITQISTAVHRLMGWDTWLWDHTSCTLLVSPCSYRVIYYYLLWLWLTHFAWFMCFGCCLSRHPCRCFLGAVTSGIYVHTTLNAFAWCGCSLAVFVGGWFVLVTYTWLCVLFFDAAFPVMWAYVIFLYTLCFGVGPCFLGSITSIHLFVVYTRHYDRLRSALNFWLVFLSALDGRGMDIMAMTDYRTRTNDPRVLMFLALRQNKI